MVTDSAGSQHGSFSSACKTLGASTPGPKFSIPKMSTWVGQDARLQLFLLVDQSAPDVVVDKIQSRTCGILRPIFNVRP